MEARRTLLYLVENRRFFSRISVRAVPNVSQAVANRVVFSRLERLQCRGGTQGIPGRYVALLKGQPNGTHETIGPTKLAPGIACDTLNQIPQVRIGHARE